MSCASVSETPPFPPLRFLLDGICSISSPGKSPWTSPAPSPTPADWEQPQIGSEEGLAAGLLAVVVYTGAVPLSTHL